MAHNLRITIPEPRHENWQQMAPADKGRHCKSCDKVVVDFSRMTDAQIADHFKNYKGKTCGRFRTEQLERPIALTAGQRLFRPIKYIAASLLAIEVFSQKVQARDVINTVTLPTIQLDSAITTSDSTADSIVTIDSGMKGTIDCCASDMLPYDYNWLTVGDTVVAPPIESIFVSTELSIAGGVSVTVGWCSMEPAIPEYKNQRPVFLYPLRQYIFENIRPFKKWNEQKLSAPSIKTSTEKQPAKNNQQKHSRLATLLRRMKIKKV